MWLLIFSAVLLASMTISLSNIYAFTQQKNNSQFDKQAIINLKSEVSSLRDKFTGALESKDEKTVIKLLVFPAKTPDKVKSEVAKLRIISYQFYKLTRKKLGDNFLTDSKFPAPPELIINEIFASKLPGQIKIMTKSEPLTSYNYFDKYPVCIVSLKLNKGWALYDTSIMQTSSFETEAKNLASRTKAYEAAIKYLNQDKDLTYKKLLGIINAPIAKILKCKIAPIEIDLSHPKNSTLSFRQATLSGDPVNMMGIMQSFGTSNELKLLSAFQKMAIGFSNFQNSALKLFGDKYKVPNTAPTYHMLNALVNKSLIEKYDVLVNRSKTKAKCGPFDLYLYSPGWIIKRLANSPMSFRDTHKMVYIWETTAKQFDRAIRLMNQKDADLDSIIKELTKDINNIERGFFIPHDRRKPGGNKTQDTAE